MVTTNPYLQLAAPGIAGLAPYEPGKPASALSREYGVQNVIKLASNENSLGPAPGVAKAVAAAATALERYPDGAAFELRQRLAEHLQVAPEQITLGNGSNDVLVLLAETFLTPAQSAVYDQYSFVVYRLAVQACGAQARVVPSLAADHPHALGHDLDAMAAAIDASTRLVFIANPNNPTGSWVEPAELHAFLAALPPHVMVVLDEAYFEYARAPGDPDALDWLETFPQLVVTRTFSKAYGIAGLRLGYAVSSPGVAELLNRVRQPFNVNSVAQAAACAALADQDWITRSVADNAIGLAELATGLAELGLSTIASRGNFLLVNFGGPARAAAANEFLLRAGIIVRPVANYGLPDYLRITVGAEAERTALLAALATFAETGG